MKKRILVIALAVVLAVGVFALTACGEPETKGPYKANQDVYKFSVTQNTSHSGLAFVHLKTDADGELTDAYLDEAFIPNEWAKITLADAKALGAVATIATATETGAAAVTGDNPVAAQPYYNAAATATFGANVTAALSSQNALSLYPTYIELTIGGTAKVYRAKVVTITNNSAKSTGFEEAAETAAVAPTGAITADNIWKGLAKEQYFSGSVRYYEVTAYGADIASGTKSLENKLSTDATFAKQYIDMLKGYELAATPVTVAAANIKYLKSATEKIETERVAAIKDYSETATTGKIAIGAAMKTHAVGTSGATANTWVDSALTGNNLAYASTFFKRNSTYTSRQAYRKNEADTTLTSIATDKTGWAEIDAIYLAFVKANLAGLTPAKAFAMAKDATTAEGYLVTNGFKNGTLITHASSYHTNIYVGLYVQAFDAVKK